MAEAAENGTRRVEAPRGVHTSRVDEKGRLKLPAAVKEYLDGLEEKTLFVTSLDLRTVRIYPISTWRANENLFAGETEDAEEAAQLNFLAQDMGHEAEVDSQARLLLPADLRRMLNLEGQPVYMNSQGTRIDVYDKATYEEQRAKVRALAVERLRRFEKKGLK